MFAGPNHECDLCALRFTRIADMNRHRMLHGKISGKLMSTMKSIAFCDDNTHIPSNLDRDQQIPSRRLRRRFDRSTVDISTVLCIECHISMSSDDHYCMFVCFVL